MAAAQQAALRRPAWLGQQCLPLLRQLARYTFAQTVFLRGVQGGAVRAPLGVVREGLLLGLYGARSKTRQLLVVVLEKTLLVRCAK